MRKDLLLAVLCLCIIYIKGNPIIINAVNDQDVTQSKEAKIEEAGKKEEATLGVFDSHNSPAQDIPKKEEELQKPAEQALLVEEQKQSSVVAQSIGADVKTDEKETGRQSSSTTSEDEDDDEDDDDDDDDLDLGIDDDDDDDDDDGDDDDYFGGLFDDIIGDDDDDDDEEEEDEPEPAPAPAAPVAPAASEVVEAVAETAEDEVAEETAEGEVYTDVTERESLIDKDPDNDVAITNNVPEPIVVQPVPADDEEDEADDDDGGDDDEEGDLEDLASDDDDDDDDDEDDDDDDEDDDVDLEDALEAKRSRESKARAMDSSPSSTKIPSVYIAKYNRFVDQIIGKINRILGRSYDPVRVKIQARKTTTNKPKTTKRKTIKRKSTRRPSSKKSASTATNKMAEIDVARAHESETREPAFVLVSKASNLAPKVRNGTVEIRASTTKNKTQKTKTKSKTKKNKTKANSGKKAPKVRATLFGLSSLRRDGDVHVHTMTDHSTVKSDFVLGPLTLRVEKEFGRGTKRELKSATATTAEMFGRLNLRIVHGGAATLHSIKVLQPKQVRVDSVDNHEKTKEFMWKRSARLAKVVSHKLAAAVRSMLQPPPSA